MFQLSVLIKKINPIMIQLRVDHYVGSYINTVIFVIEKYRLGDR